MWQKKKKKKKKKEKILLITRFSFTEALNLYHKCCGSWPSLSQEGGSWLQKRSHFQLYFTSKALCPLEDYPFILLWHHSSVKSHLVINPVVSDTFSLCPQQKGNQFSQDTIKPFIQGRQIPAPHPQLDQLCHYQR